MCVRAPVRTSALTSPHTKTTLAVESAPYPPGALEAQMRCPRCQYDNTPRAKEAGSAPSVWRIRRRFVSDVPKTRYAKSSGVNIAYQVVGEGPLDLVYVPGWISNVEMMWENPQFARFLRRLASFSLLIIFDKRGTGLSDRVAELPTLEQRMDDVRAVMDAAGSGRAALFGHSESASMCILFAATYPERTIALVTYGAFATRLRSEDYPWGQTLSASQRSGDSKVLLYFSPPGAMIDSATAPPRSAAPGSGASYGRASASLGPTIRIVRAGGHLGRRASWDRVLHGAGSRLASARLPEVTACMPRRSRHRYGRVSEVSPGSAPRWPLKVWCSHCWHSWWHSSITVGPTRSHSVIGRACSRRRARCVDPCDGG